jgi:putative ABC transport system permease protein
LATFGVEALETTVLRSVGDRRFTMLLLGAFAMLALLLAVVGVHGVLSYAVYQRRQEIGIRVALGAPAGRIVGNVVRSALVLATTGIGLGLAGAWAVTRVLSSVLYGVSATDAAVFASVPLILILTALLAAYLPARRAARVDPMVALRAE